MLNQELFEKCKRGEGSAQRALYELYKARLMGLCRRYAHDTEDARDVLQESFVKIFSRLHQVDSVDKLEMWMKTVVVRTSIDHYHKRKRLTLQAYSEKDYELSDTDYDLILENLTDDYLIQAIHSLPEGCRLVFNLFEVEGYAHSEIAEMLSISEGTSRSQLHHAKYLLKQKLSRLGVKRYEKLA